MNDDGRDYTPAKRIEELLEERARDRASRDDLIAQVRKLEAERDDLRAKLRVVETPATDVWIWSGDRRELASDESTLTCPVVMRAEKARELLALVDEARNERALFEKRIATLETATREAANTLRAVLRPGADLSFARLLPDLLDRAIGEPKP